MKKISYLSFCLSILFSLNISAAPTGQQLLDACEHAITSGFKGIEGMACEWYVIPCDCGTGTHALTPRVCLPDDASSADLAQKVVDGLKDEPNLAGKSAGFAAATILSRSYPCSK